METKIILGDVGSGKTDALIKISHDTGQYIVCRMSAVHEIASRARFLKTPVPFPISYGEFIEKRYYGKGIKGFLVDDVDALLNEMTRGVPVTQITMRSDDWQPTKDFNDMSAAAIDSAARIETLANRVERLEDFKRNSVLEVGLLVEELKSWVSNGAGNIWDVKDAVSNFQRKWMEATNG